MTRHALCLTLLFLSSHTLACTYLPAAAAFVVINDHDNDRALSWEEWQIASIDNNLELDFKLGDEATFKFMDKNQDNRLEAREIGFGRVRYLQIPCERRHSFNRPSFMPTNHRTFGFQPHPH